MIIKLLVVCQLFISIGIMAQPGDPGIPPGGDPDIDEVPLDQYVCFLLVTGAFYGWYKVNWNLKKGV